MGRPQYSHFGILLWRCYGQGVDVTSWVLGRGAVGTVFAGTYDGDDIAVKIIDFQHAFHGRRALYKCTLRELDAGRAVRDYMKEGSVSEEDTRICACRHHCEYTSPHMLGTRLAFIANTIRLMMLLCLLCVNE